MSIGDIKIFTISQNGFTLKVQAMDLGYGQTEFRITSVAGQGDLNAIWWSDGDSLVEGNITLSKSDNALNMNGTGVAWDGYKYLSSAGLGPAGETKSTFITAGETLTFTGVVNLSSVSILGLRATSVNGGDSIKGVDTTADQTYLAPKVSINDVCVTEGGKAEFTISLSNAYPYDVKVYYGTENNSAWSGSDYDTASGYVIIPAGQTSAKVTVQTVDNYYAEGDETFAVKLSNATADVPGPDIPVTIADDTGVGTIKDDVDTTTITLSAPAAVDEGGSITVSASVDHAPLGTNLVITLSNGQVITILENNTTGSVTFPAPSDDPYIDAGTLNLSITTATGGSYEQLNTSATADIAVDDTIDTTTVSLSASTVFEGPAADYVFTATLSNASVGDTTIVTDQGNIVIGDGLTAGTLTIASGNTEDVYDDDTSLTATITSASGGDFEDLDIGTASATAHVDDTIDTTTVSLNDPTVSEGGNVTITASVNNAPQGSNLVITLSNNEWITILAGQTSGSVTFAAPSDDPYVDAGSYNLTIASATGGDFEALNTSDVATVTVNDTINATTVTLDDVTASEGTTATITAHVNNAVTGSDLVLNLNNGATVTIAVGQTSGTSTAFAIADNNVYGDSTSYIVGVGSTSGGNYEALTTTDTATVTVNDNDQPPSFSINDVTVSESAGTITFTVTKTGATALSASVNYAVAPDTATAGSDYAAGTSALTGTLNFASNETTKTITLNIVDNNVFEPTEQFFVNLSGATNATISDPQGIGTITDNDNGPTAANDRLVISNDRIAVFSASALLGNDTDPNFDQLQILSVSGANVSYNSTTQTIAYDTNPISNNTVNSASFTYQVSDGHGGVATATVFIDTVNGDNVNLLTAYSTAGSYQASYIDSGNGTDNDTGGPSGDTLIGGNGKDSLTGGNGGDILRGGQDNDSIDGQGATGDVDLIDFSDGTGAGVTFTLVQSSSDTVFIASSANLGTDTYRNIEGVIGTTFDDTLNGSAGNDTIIGNGGNDTINGNAGNDRIHGGLGVDTMNGNADADTFVLTATNESGIGSGNRDIIAGFVTGADKIDLSAIDAAVQAGFDGDQSFTFVNNATPAIDPGVQANSVTWFQQLGNTIVQLDNTGDTIADMQIQLSGLISLSASDFVL